MSRPLVKITILHSILNFLSSCSIISSNPFHVHLLYDKKHFFRRIMRLFWIDSADYRVDWLFLIFRHLCRFLLFGQSGMVGGRSRQLKIRLLSWCLHALLYLTGCLDRNGKMVISRFFTAARDFAPGFLDWVDFGLIWGNSRSYRWQRITGGKEFVKSFIWIWMHFTRRLR